ncbi:MAG: hypothetical protein LAT55_09095 [Opitutales bacterium]|nr:hypothetical protein [Opitutales bacterium]
MNNSNWRFFVSLLASALAGLFLVLFLFFRTDSPEPSSESIAFAGSERAPAEARAPSVGKPSQKAFPDEEAERLGQRGPDLLDPANWPEPRVEDLPDPRPIESFPVLTWADRIDEEGQVAPRIVRGSNERRVLDRPERVEPARDNPHPWRPFGRVQTAREDSYFAQDPHTREAIEVGISHQVFAAAAEGTGHRMKLPLTGDREVTLSIETIHRRGPATTSFMGRVEEYPDSEVILVYNEGAVAGGVALNRENAFTSEYFAWQSMEDGLVAVKLQDEASFLAQPCGLCGDLHLAGERAGESGDPEEDAFDHEPQPWSPPASGEDVFLVDLVVGYGVESRIADGGVAGIEARIIAGVERMNLSLTNSLVDNLEVVLVGMLEESTFFFSSFSGGLDDVLEELSGGPLTASALPLTRGLRRDLGADLKAFIVANSRSGLAGVAQLPGPSSVTARTYVSNNRATFVHELGHNFGLRHAFGDTSSDSIDRENHNYGWRFQSGESKRRTIMAYNWGWSRALHFSNPEVLHPTLGVPTGAPDGYDATDDASVDPSLRQEYDGSHPLLGARAADYLISRAEATSQFSTRAGLGLLQPADGRDVPYAFPSSLLWTGGTFHDTIEIELWQDGEWVLDLVATLTGEDSLGNGVRSLEWTPETLGLSGEDFQLYLNLNDGEETFWSHSFAINPELGRVVSATPAMVPPAEPGVETVTFTFNRPMDPDSFSPGEDLTFFEGPGQTDYRPQVSGVDWNAEQTELILTLDPPLTDQGFYRVEIGPEIEDRSGLAMDQNENGQPGEADDGFGFFLHIQDPADPQVPAPSLSRSDPDGKVFDAPSRLRLFFTQPMDTQTFSETQISSFERADGTSVTISGTQWKEDHLLEIEFAEIAEFGVYTLTLEPGLEDFEGQTFAEPIVVSFEWGAFDAPVILTEELPLVMSWAPYAATVEVVSPDGFPLTLWMEGLPQHNLNYDRLTFTDNGDGTGSIAGEIIRTLSESTEYEVTLFASDGGQVTEKVFILQAEPASRLTVKSPPSTIEVEEGAVVTLEVERERNTRGAVSIDYELRPALGPDYRSAEEGSEFPSSSGTILWEDGDAENWTLDIPIPETGESRGRRGFRLFLLNGTIEGPAVMGDAFLNIVIEDAHPDNPPEVAFDPAVDPPTGTSSARVQAEVQSLGTNHELTVFYDTVDHGNDPADWETNAGQQAFSSPVFGENARWLEGLASGTTYYYRFRSTNDNGVDWTATGMFQTTRAYAQWADLLTDEFGPEASTGPTDLLPGLPVANLSAYAFGIDPAERQHERLPTFWMEEFNGESYPFLRYFRHAYGSEDDANQYASDNLRYIIEHSVDLEEWVSEIRTEFSGGYIWIEPVVFRIASELHPEEDPPLEEVTYRIDFPANDDYPKGFLRVRIEKIEE